MINNRQVGRRRGRGGQQQRPQGGSGRPDNGNRIDNRARGNAAQLLEKYKTLARDAQMQGDRVNVEYYLQFADHYFRVLAETRARLEENGGQPLGRRPQGATLDDEQDYEDEGDRTVPQEQERGDTGYRGQEAMRDPRPREGQDGRNGHSNYHGNGGGTFQREDRGPREERAPRDDRNAGRTNGNAGGDYRGGEQQMRPPREDRDDRPRRFEPRIEQQAEPQVDTPEPVQDIAPVAETPAEAPRRGRGRPRRIVPVEDAPSDAERLPPSLGVSAVIAEPESPVPESATEEKPRRRRGRPPASARVAD